MATYDSSYLLAMFNRKAGRPSTDAISDADKYAELSESQNRIIAMMSTVAPDSLYQQDATADLPQLETVDNQVFTFGEDDNDYPIFPISARIYANLGDIPNRPWLEGVDYIREGTQIRIPNNRTYAGTLYWQGIVNPPDIDANHQPSLFPEAARELIVFDAVENFALNYLRQPDLAGAMGAAFQKAWGVWCTVWRKQFRHGGAVRVNGLVSSSLRIL